MRQKKGNRVRVRSFVIFIVGFRVGSVSRRTKSIKNTSVNTVVVALFVHSFNSLKSLIVIRDPERTRERENKNSIVVAKWGGTFFIIIW